MQQRGIDPPEDRPFEIRSWGHAPEPPLPAEPQAERARHANKIQGWLAVTVFGGVIAFTAWKFYDAPSANDATVSSAADPRPH